MIKMFMLTSTKKYEKYWIIKMFMLASTKKYERY